MAEWKWDGIRAQLIRRAGPDVPLVARRGAADRPVSRARRGRRRCCPTAPCSTASCCPGPTSAPLPFAQLQRRIGRKTLEPQDPRRGAGRARRLRPAGAERRGPARRCRSSERRAPLAALLARDADGRTAAALARRAGRTTGRAVGAARDRAREVGAEGLMLKRLSSGVRRRAARGATGGSGRSSRYTVDAVLIYAQPGSGRRAGLFTDYTFGVWDGDRLVPFAKAYSGLTDEEIRKVDALRPAEHGREVRPGARGRSRSWCSSWRSRASSARHGTSRASRCAFPGCCAGGRTSGRRRRIRWLA